VPESATFKLTWLVKPLSAGYRASSLVEEAGAEAVSWLQEQVRWQTSLATPEKGYMLVKESTRFRGLFVFDSGGIGFKPPMYTSATRLALLDFAPPQTQQIILDINARRIEARPQTQAHFRLIMERDWSMPKTMSKAQ
jgi:IclR family mhp operon transcriptional activator